MISRLLNISKYISCVSGNTGGYLGLFLGYALLNVPELVQEGFTWVCRACKTMKNKAATIQGFSGKKSIYARSLR